MGDEGEFTMAVFWAAAGRLRRTAPPLLIFPADWECSVRVYCHELRV